MSTTTRVVEQMAEGKIIPLYNEEILAEYEDVLSREHFRINYEEQKALFDYIRKNGIATERTTFNEIFRDESDRVFYKVALSEEESFLVTGNLKHYPVTPRVVSPAQMLEILGEE